MSCVNGGKDELSTTQALHTYYRVSAIDDVIVHGLEGTPYLDNLAGRETKPGEAGPVTFSCEVDRIYAGAGACPRPGAGLLVCVRCARAVDAQKQTHETCACSACLCVCVCSCKCVRGAGSHGRTIF